MRTVLSGIRLFNDTILKSQTSFHIEQKRRGREQDSVETERVCERRSMVEGGGSVSCKTSHWVKHNGCDLSRIKRVRLHKFQTTLMAQVPQSVLFLSRWFLETFRTMTGRIILTIIFDFRSRYSGSNSVPPSKCSMQFCSSSQARAAITSASETIRDSELRFLKPGSQYQNIFGNWIQFRKFQPVSGGYSRQHYYTFSSVISLKMFIIS